MSFQLPTPVSIETLSNDDVILLIRLALRDSARRINNYRQQDDAAALLDGIKFAGAIKELLDEAMYHVGGPLLYCAEEGLIKRMRKARYPNEDR